MKASSLLVSIVLLAAMPSVSMATYINLNSSDMSGLLGGSWIAMGSPTLTEMDSATLDVTARSQAFTNGSSYVYLYQLANVGITGQASIELFTIAPIAVGGMSDLGILSGDAPSGFTASLNTPGPKAKTAPVTGGDVISFYFEDMPGVNGTPIVPSQSSSILYLASALPPDQITGNVIDGTIGTGPVVGPAPEPATMSLLAIGGLAALLRRKK
jgi:hypothetical protein